GALARAKAEAVAAGLGGGAAGAGLGDGAAGAGPLVLGCDSLLDVDGDAQGKPGTAAVAAERWRRIRGRSAVLVTGHHLVDTVTGRSCGDVAATTVRFGCPTDAEIDAYVATGEPLEVAGGFTLDGRAAAFVDGVDGDPNNVLGVSVALLRQLLGRLDVEITSLWR
ncbi:MAG TPA: Maf family protein, partial [Acidimicrobiales bacterium]|nr:Maf family protein [Acidimicrobiales bacterium]